MQSPITHHNAAEQIRGGQGRLESWSSPECNCPLPMYFEVLLMPRSICRNDARLGLCHPRAARSWKISLNAPLGQFHSLHTHRMMQKATEPQAQFKGLDFN